MPEPVIHHLSTSRGCHLVILGSIRGGPVPPDSGRAEVPRCSPDLVTAARLGLSSGCWLSAPGDTLRAGYPPTVSAVESPPATPGDQHV